jgi:hypothetical protein
VNDYAAGKTDWMAADLPFEGTASLAGMLTRRGVATASERTPAAEAVRLLEAQGFGPVLVLNQAGVVMGAAPAQLRPEFSPARPPGLGGGHRAFGLADAVAHEPCGGSPVQGYKG